MEIHPTPMLLDPPTKSSLQFQCTPNQRLYEHSKPLRAKAVLLEGLSCPISYYRAVVIKSMILAQKQTHRSTEQNTQ